MTQNAQAITEHLYLNPWSTTRFTAGITGVPPWRTLETLSDASVCERIRVPISNQIRQTPAHITIFALTQAGQEKHIGEYRSPTTLAEAMALTYERLEIARNLIGEFKKGGHLLWTISPWRSSKKSPIYDALMCLKVGNSAYLMAIVIPPQYATFDWYEEIARKWADWRKKGGYILPAVLLLYRPKLTKSALEHISTFSPPANGGIIAFTGKDISGAKKDDWKKLRPRKGGDTLPYPAPHPLAANLFNARSLVGDARRMPRRGAMTLRSWASRHDSDKATITKFLLDTSRPVLDALNTIARYPAIDGQGIKYLITGSRARQRFTENKRSLESHGLIEEIDGMEKHFIINNLGLLTMGMLSGITANQMNRHLGWPFRPRLFTHQREHTNRVSRFALQLAKERKLLAWDFIRARYTYLVAHHSLGHQRVKRVTVYPDTAGAILLDKNTLSLFWLEVDRGTRFGRKLNTQLEKYFLIRYALYSPTPIPPLLYIVDTGDGRDEGRLKSIAGRLETISKAYPRNTLHVALTTAELLDQADGSLMDRKIWRLFSRGEFHPKLLSLKESCTQRHY